MAFGRFHRQALCRRKPIGHRSQWMVNY
jgi:hypothetical protein